MARKQTGGYTLKEDGRKAGKNVRSVRKYDDGEGLEERRKGRGAGTN